VTAFSKDNWCRRKFQQRHSAERPNVTTECETHRRTRTDKETRFPEPAPPRRPQRRQTATNLTVQLRACCIAIGRRRALGPGLNSKCRAWPSGYLHLRPTAELGWQHLYDSQKRVGASRREGIWPWALRTLPRPRDRGFEGKGLDIDASIAGARSYNRYVVGGTQMAVYVRSCSYVGRSWDGVESRAKSEICASKVGTNAVARTFPLQIYHSTGWKSWKLNCS